MPFNKLPGYVGYSMSVNAKYAYDTGEKPYSKWNKKDIISFIFENFGEEWKKKYEKYSLSTLKTILLCQSSCHHTSKYFNETIFYFCEILITQEIKSQMMRSLIYDFKAVYSLLVFLFYSFI